MWEAIGLLSNEGFVQLFPQLGAVGRKNSWDKLIVLYGYARSPRTAAQRYARKVAESRSHRAKISGPTDTCAAYSQTGIMHDDLKNSVARPHIPSVHAVVKAN